MKIKTSIAVEEDLLKRIDKLVGSRRFASRSHFFERAAKELLMYEELLLRAESEEARHKAKEDIRKLRLLRRKMLERMGGMKADAEAAA